MSEISLRGQAALVTGASHGIGRAIALALARAGASVAVNFHSDDRRAADVVDAIGQAGGTAFAVRADVSREEDVDAMVRETIDRFGTIDILVNNSGIQKDSPFTKMTRDDWQRVIDVNLTGQFLVSRAVVPEFLRRGVVATVSAAAGKIICISSVHDRIPWAGRVNYATSKGGVKMFMESLAQEMAPRRIRVNGISPGAVKTEINRDDWNGPDGGAQTLKQIPYGRWGEPDDIAKAALWLASDESDYVTGATLYVDGGMTLYPSFLEA